MANTASPFQQLAIAWLHVEDGRVPWLSSNKDGRDASQHRWPLTRASEMDNVIAYRHEAPFCKPALTFLNVRPEGYTHTTPLSVVFPQKLPTNILIPGRLRLVA